MKRFVADADGKIADSDEATPTCGFDYCDDCGDCLACCSGDLCRSSKDGHHRWVVYPEGKPKEQALQ